VKITGSMVAYYVYCRRKCWLFYHQINLEENSEDVLIGRILHEVMEGEGEELALENVKLDKLTRDYVVELKKSDSDVESAKWQLLYYLYILKKYGIERKGRLEVWEKKKGDKKRYEVELTAEAEKRLEQMFGEIENLVSSPTPPPPLFNHKCRKCAYRDYCFI